VSPLLVAVLLGAVQGVTEFLPISSSGHLKLLEQFIPPQGDALAFDLALHVGTLVPVVVLFREDLMRMVRDAVVPSAGAGPWSERPGVRWAMWVVLASVPTAIMGLALEDYFEEVFSSFGQLSWQFAVTAVALHLSGRLGPGTRDVSDMTWRDALLVGTAQGIAILPAVSRSGATIVCAIMLGMRRDVAGRFSFVLSIPAIVGAVLLKGRKVDVSTVDLSVWAVGAATSMVVGWFALTLLLRVINAGEFRKFAGYCWLLAGVCAWLAFAA
jgi:undecaprenyl-diphosphatase